MALARSFSPSSRRIWSSTKCLPKPFVRLFVVCLVCIIFVIHLSTRQPPNHPPFEPPNLDLTINGQNIHQVPTLYPLHPFPHTPIQKPLEDENDTTPKPWLTAVVSAACDVERRMLIRSTWMHLYRDLPFDRRFVVSNPGPNWTEIVAMENRTFGDMIVLDHLQEDHITANTVKTLELYKWLLGQNRTYEFVSKIDTDLWLNARGFWDRFLVPRLSINEEGRVTSAVERTIIGQLYYSNKGLTFPHGSIYTVTWDIVELLVELQNQFNVVVPEDMAVGLLMLKGRQTVNFVNFRGTEKFDYADGDSRQDGTAWARKATHSQGSLHALSGEDVIAVHQLKDKALWFKVAECFDESGLKKMSEGPEGRPSNLMLWHDFWNWMGVDGPLRPRVDRIPQHFWSEENGSWIVDGVWNMGKTKTGYIEP